MALSAGDGTENTEKKSFGEFFSFFLCVLCAFVRDLYFIIKTENRSGFKPFVLIDLLEAFGYITHFLQKNLT